MAEWDSTGQAHTVDGLKAGAIYTLHETKAPDGYEVAADSTFTIDKDGKVTGSAKVNADGVVLVENKKKVQSGNGLIKVTKYTLKKDGAFKVVDQTFYTALFSDSALTNRVSDIKALVLKNAYTNEVTFSGLAFGTYYVAETDASGTPMTSSSTVTKVELVNNVATLSQASPSADAIIKNTMAEGVLGEYVSVNLNVKKKVTGSDGSAAKVNETFYFAVFSDPDFRNQIRGTHVQAISLENASDGMTVFRDLPYTDEIYVAEVDKKGKPVSAKSGFKYKVSYSDNGLSYARSDGGEITVTNKGEGKFAGANREAAGENRDVNGDNRTDAAVRTGDTTPVVPMLVTMILAAAAALFLVFVRRRMKRGNAH